MSDALLISPPWWDPYAPSAANPALLGYLRTRGYSATQIDLNQMYFKAQFDGLVQGALHDFADAEALATRVPVEHRVIAGLDQPVPDLLHAWKLPDSALTFDGYRDAIESWDRLEALNVIDAVLHYGYFIRQSPAIQRVLVDRFVLDDPAWQPLRELVQRELLPRLEREEPHIVGISVLGEQQVAGTIALTAWMREAGVPAMIVWGGSHVRPLHSQASNADSWWRRLPDCVVLGEGETALTMLADRARAAYDPRDPHWAERVQFSKRPGHRDFIPGVIGQPLERTLLAPKRYENVSELSDYDATGLDLHGGYLMPWPVIPYQGSRGCHWGLCGFCDHEEGYRLGYRPKAAEQVVDNLLGFRERFGIEHIQFVDEAIEPAWLREFNEEIEHRDLSGAFRWSNYSKVSNELDRDLLDRTFTNGGRLILFGVESFNQRVLNVVKKGIRRKDAMATLRATHDAGIRTWVWLIAGLPTQTIEELAGDIADLRSLDGIVDAVSVGRYRISENSDIFREMKKFGIVHADLSHPMDVQYTSAGMPVDNEAIARMFYDEYYPTAISMSLTHNRYLLFADALKQERRLGQPLAARSSSRPARILDGVATDNVVGNI